MRVLIVDASSKLGTVGGAQRVAANLLYELRKKGIDTYYFGYKTHFLEGDKKAMFIGAGEGQKRLVKSMAGNGIKGKIAESIPARAAYYSFYSMTGIDISQYGDWLEDVRPDIVVSNSIQDFVVLKKLKNYVGNAKFVYIDHANVAGDYKGSLDYNIMALTFGTGHYVGLDMAKRRHLGFFDGVVALNRMQQRAIRRFNKNVTVIHSSSLLPPQKIKKSKLKELQGSLGIKENDNVVLYVGRLNEAQKNLSVLIKACRNIDDKHLKLVLFGAGGKSVELYKQLAGDDRRINIVGGGPSVMVPYYYLMSGLYVLPSIWEGFNATLIEAATFGVPLLLSTKSINEDIVERFGKRLCLFDPHDQKELESKIVKCFYDKSLRKRLKLLSKDIAIEYSKSKQIDGYAKALNHLYATGKLE